MINVEESPGKGRGVFATRDIKNGEIIEHSPVIIIPQEQQPYIRKTVLKRYVFRWGTKMKDYAIALGVGSLINHSYNPNAVYQNVLEDRCVEFAALRDIYAGEEITVNYNRNPANMSPMKFEVLD